MADILQIPAFLCRQTDLPLLAGRGRSGRIVMKKGQLVAPHAIHRAAEKVSSTGPSQVVLTERGSSFGYNNLVVDMRGLKIMRDAGSPVVFDATECSTSGRGGRRLGWQLGVHEPLARAAVAVGVNGVFVEVHDAPEKALSDGANALRLELLAGFWERVKAVHEVLSPDLRSFAAPSHRRRAHRAAAQGAVSLGNGETQTYGLVASRSQAAYRHP